MKTINIGDLEKLGLKVNSLKEKEEIRTNQVKLINKQTGVEKPVYDPIATKLKVQKELEPLFNEARKTGKWFKITHSDRYFSPDELEELQSENHFIWGRVHFELVDPSEYVEELERRIRVETEKLEEVFEEIKKHEKYEDKTHVSDLDSYLEGEEEKESLKDILTDKVFEELDDIIKDQIVRNNAKNKSKINIRTIEIPLKLEKEITLNHVVYKGIKYNKEDQFSVMSTRNLAEYKKGERLPKGDYVIKLKMEE